MPQPRRRRLGPKSDRRRALELLAASRDGCTEALIAHGFHRRADGRAYTPAEATCERVVIGR